MSSFLLSLSVSLSLSCLCFCLCIGATGRSSERPVVFLEREREIFDDGAWHVAARGRPCAVGTRVENEFSLGR